MLKEFPPTDDPTLPSYECECYLKLKDSWLFIRDFLAGSRAWVTPQSGVFDEDKAKKYLPKETAEALNDWKFRVMQTPFVGRSKRAIAGFANLLTNFEANDLANSIKAIEEDFDKRGNSMVQFAKLADCHALSYGLAWVGAEYTALPTAQNRAEEIQQQKRAWACLYHPLNVINWKTEFRNGEEKLSLLVIKRQQATAKDYGSETKTIYRVFVPGRWVDYEIVKRKDEQSKKWQKVVINKGELSIDEIPVIPYYDGLSLNEIEPPLYAVFDLELRQYRLQSDYYSCLHACNRAIPVSVGRVQPGQNPQDVSPLTLGSYHEIMVPEGGNFFFAEPSGSALASTMGSIEKIDQDIDRESLQFVGRTAGDVSATEAELTAKATEGTLIGMARSKESTFQTVFRILAQYANESEGGTITVNRNLLQPKPTVEAIALLFNAGLISKESAINQIALTVPGVNPEEELKRLQAEFNQETQGIAIADEEL